MSYTPRGLGITTPRGAIGNTPRGLSQGSTPRQQLGQGGTLDLTRRSIYSGLGPPQRMPSPSGSRSPVGDGPATMPYLPGHQEHDLKQMHHKSQTLNYGPGGAVDAVKGAGESIATSLKFGMPKLDLATLQLTSDPAHRYDYSAKSLTHEERNTRRESGKNSYSPPIAPNWLKHDKEVLRFFAYFQESVHESPLENCRVRRCSVNFFLEDGTIMVSEPKVENSGMLGGTIVRRHRIPKPHQVGQGFYSYRDLACGRSISIYGRSFRLVDCDDFTRKFYASDGLDAGAPEAMPVDAFRVKVEQRKAAIGAPIQRQIAESKEYNELAVGGSRRNAKLEQYLENDRKVLSFKAYWDDPTRYGTRQYYAFLYYLSDDTAEIHEDLAKNSGRDPYPVFWKRAPLPRNPHVSCCPGMLEPDVEIFKPEDFKVGEDVDVYGRRLHLYDCDGFTRDFYRTFNGYEQGREPQAPDPHVHQELRRPPHTGFGGEEDSLASCLRLTPRPPRRDMAKLIGNDGKVLRFKALMATQCEEDVDRRFVVSVRLADDAVSVWECRQRNSGHTEGMFATNGKKRNPATGRWFVPQDFYIGATLVINSTPFAMIDCDEATFSLLKSEAGSFPYADVGLIASKLRGLGEGLSGAPAAMAPDALGRLAEERLGLRLLRHELVTLARAFPCEDAPEAVDTAALRERLA